MPPQQHAQPGRIEVEFVSFWQSCQRMPDEHHLELQSLKFIRRLDDDIAQSLAVKSNAEEIFLIVVGDSNRHPARPH
jgi:hypothetical protein